MRSNELLTIIRRERSTKTDGSRVSRRHGSYLFLQKPFILSSRTLSPSIIYLDFFRSIHQDVEKKAQRYEDIRANLIYTYSVQSNLKLLPETALFTLHIAPFRTRVSMLQLICGLASGP